MSEPAIASDNRPAERTTLAAFRPTSKEIGALICALLPSALFVGTTNRVVVNGQVLRDESFNLFGVILAVIALGLVVGGFRMLNTKFLRGPKALHAAFLAALGLLGLFQLTRSAAIL